MTAAASTKNAKRNDEVFDIAHNCTNVGIDFRSAFVKTLKLRYFGNCDVVSNAMGIEFKKFIVYIYWFY